MAKELSAVPQTAAWTVAAVIGGLLLLIGGLQILVTGAVGIVQDFGLSEAVIGLTLVAVGTSLPEFSISVIAALRRHADVAVGNVFGSNIFNILAILGVSSLLQPLPAPARILNFDHWVMSGSALLLLIILFTGNRLNRRKGVILLACYAAYRTLSSTVFSS